jgi:hypothetical protein
MFLYELLKLEFVQCQLYFVLRNVRQTGYQPLQNSLLFYQSVNHKMLKAIEVQSSVNWVLIYFVRFPFNPLLGETDTYNPSHFALPSPLTLSSLRQYQRQIKCYTRLCIFMCRFTWLRSEKLLLQSSHWWGFSPV